MKTIIDELGKVSVTVEKEPWNDTKDYDKLTIVYHNFGTHISRKPVPAGKQLSDKEYWIPFSSLQEEVKIQFANLINTDEKHTNDINKLKIAVDNLTTAVDNLNIDIDITTLNTIKNQLSEHLVEYDSLNKDYQQYKEYSTAEHIHINEKLEGIDEVKNVVKQLKDSQYGFKVCNEVQTPGTTTSDSFTCNVHFVNFDRNGQTSTKQIKIPSATSDFAGVMSANDKAKLDNLSDLNSKAILSLGEKFGTKQNGDVWIEFKRADNIQDWFSIPKASDSNSGIITKEMFNGIPFMENKKIPVKYLPDHLDDIIEYDTKENFPENGEKGVLYVALDTNHFYRWSGSSYIDMSDVNPTTITFGEEKGTAYEGDKGKKNADDIAEINDTINRIKPLTVVSSIGTTSHNANNISIGVRFNNTDGTNVVNSNMVINAATTEKSGVLTPTDKTKIDNIPSKIIKDIHLESTDTTYIIQYESTTGNNHQRIDPASTIKAGVMTAADKINLNNLVANSHIIEHFNISVNTNNWSGTIDGGIDKLVKGNSFRLVKSDTSPSNNGILGYLLDTEYIITHIETVQGLKQVEAIGTCGQLTLTVNNSTGAVESIEVAKNADGHQYNVAKVLSTNDYTNNDKNRVDNLPSTIINSITGFSANTDSITFKGQYSYRDTDVSEIFTRSIPKVTTSLAGVMTATDKVKLDSIDTTKLVTTDSNGKIPNDLLPSYVSDILEYSNKDAFPITGTTGKIYVDIATNKTYRWSGTQYILIGDGTGISVTGKLINATSGTATYERNAGTIKIPIKDVSTSTESNFTIPLKGADETYAGLFAANDKKKLNGITKNTHTLDASIDNESGATFTWQEQVNDETNNWQTTSNQFNIPIVSDTSAGLVTKDMLNSNSGTDIRNIQLELIDDYNGNVTIKNSSFTPNLGDFVTVTVLDSNDNVINNHEYNGVYQVVVHNIITNKITTKLFGNNGVIDINKINNTTTIKYSTIGKGKTVNATLNYDSQESSVLWYINDTISVGDKLHITYCSNNLLGGILADADIQIIGEYGNDSIKQYIGITYVYVSNPYAQHVYVIYGIRNYGSTQNNDFIDLLGKADSYIAGSSSFNTIDVCDLNRTNIPSQISTKITDNVINLQGSILTNNQGSLKYNLNYNQNYGCLVTPKLINSIINTIITTETKLNNFLTSTDATDDAITTWAEIQNFLDGIKDTSSLANIRQALIDEATYQGSKAYQDAKNYVDGKNFITSSSLTKSSVGLGNVDNTSDLAKPVSTATQNALNNKVDKIAGKGLSTNDFTNALKTKLEELSTSSGTRGNYYIANIVNNKLVVGGNDIKNIISNGDAFYIEDEKVVSDTNVFQSNWVVVNVEGDSINSYSIVALGKLGELLYNVVDGTPIWTINSSFVRKVNGKQLSSNDYTNTDKSIIDSLTEVGEVSNGVRNITTLADKVSINNAIYNFSDNDYNILSIDIPAASITKAGVMTADDKSKLDNLGNVKALTTAQYNALTTKDSNTIYFLTD